MECRNAEQGKITGHHDDIRMGEVDHQQDAVHHGIADGDKGIQAAQGNTVHHMLDKAYRSHVGYSLKKLHICCTSNRTVRRPIQMTA